MAIKNQEIKDNYAVYNGDCNEVMKNMPNDSIHLSVYSPPFGGLYNYSSDPLDISNCYDYDEFFVHYGYVVKDLNRITMPGRITAVHCTDIPTGNCGRDSLIDLPGDIIKLHKDNGWEYIARHTIWKEPLWVRNRTMAHNLSHRTIVEDGVYGGVASADYLVLFRKKGENKIPVLHNTGLSYYAGESVVPTELLKYKNWSGKQTENRYSHWIWRQYASSVWDDVRMGRVLPFKDCKEPDDEKHVHPLQLDVIDRVIVLRSNPGEIVFSPFGGVGSEPYSAVSLGRKGVAVELKESYYRQMVHNLNDCRPGIYEEQSIEQLELKL